LKVENHYRFLEQLYYRGPINGLLKQSIEVRADKCVITHEVDPQFFHAGNALHGAMYFKLLDDSAYFACAGREKEFFIVTISFTLDLMRPVDSGKLRAEGCCTGEENGILQGESILYNEEGKVVAKGNGKFARSKTRIADLAE